MQDEGGNLRRAIVLAAGIDPSVAVGALDDLVRDQLGVFLGDRIVEPAADEALHRENRVVGIGDRLPLCRLADQAFAVLGEGHDRWSGPRAFRILDDLRLAAFHDCNAAVRRPQVDADDLSHMSSSSVRPRAWLSAPANACFVGDIGVLRCSTRAASCRPEEAVSEPNWRWSARARRTKRAASGPVCRIC
jgi:hypothetical protein